MSEPLTVSIIIQEAGGAPAIERAAKQVGSELTSDAVYKWRKTGIPDRRWPLVLSLTCYSVEQLFRANCRARNVPERVVLEDPE